MTPQPHFVTRIGQAPCAVRSSDMLLASTALVALTALGDTPGAILRMPGIGPYLPEVLP
ncbi:hypothetical protein Q4543_15630 [Salipiger sp. 1_MG-2023]|uniref:hypothetical protein n=1 Tax=Salipiger sp. 1_MG-2023 TaxID=3062665 RepID=UPI0026E43E7F|nr:hypothetical protein [Salipiger sp. 1_MG-2023]MDO6586944.1 hypothetical protein [Salipiger sp. 1_MG-2023]